MKQIIIAAPLIILAFAFVYIAFRPSTNTNLTNNSPLPITDNFTPVATSLNPASSNSFTEGESQLYTSPEFGISLQYPNDWTQRTPSSPDELFTIYQRGETQRPQSEMSDGAILIINKPIAAPPDLQAWMKQKYEIDNADTMTSPTTYSSTTANDITYQTANVCGLGCATYYNTIQNNKLYVFIYVTEGPRKAMFDAELAKILESVNFK